MKVDITVPDGVSGDWSVNTFTVDPNDFTQKIAAMKCGRSVPGGTYKRLQYRGTTVMTNTPDEITDCLDFLYRAHGSVLLNGLGLGLL